MQWLYKMLTFLCCKKISHTLNTQSNEAKVLYCRNTWLYTSQISSRRNNRNTIWTLCVQYVCVCVCVSDEVILYTPLSQPDGDAHETN